MKNQKRICVVFFSFVALLSCQLPEGSTGTSLSSPDPGLPIVINTSIEVIDAAGTFLGYCTGSSSMKVTIFTPKGFFLGLHWDGSLPEGPVYFKGFDGTGVPFITSWQGYAIYGYSVVLFGTPHVISDMDSNGFGIPDTSITHMNSSMTEGKITNYYLYYGIPATSVAYKLRPSSRSEVGIPEVITGPLVLRFK
jgi:hypothetical protein